ncbi:MAG: TetR/AcrR family transcriptional regulator [Pseudomonadota bacterium]
MALGRPRAFDADAMLDKVVDVFWQHGYEGSSMAALTTATGLSKPSLYAAFGGKEDLFRAAFVRYRERQDQFTGNLLSHPVARTGVERLLLALVDSLTQPEMPHGCLLVHGNLVGSPDSDTIREELRQHRKALQAAVRERLAQAQQENEIDADVNLSDLARYITTTAQGLAVQAADGAQRKSLHRVVELAMLAWPVKPLQIAAIPLPT